MGMEGWVVVGQVGAVLCRCAVAAPAELGEAKVARGLCCMQDGANERIQMRKDTGQHMQEDSRKQFSLAHMARLKLATVDVKVRQFYTTELHANMKHAAC